MDDEAVNVDVQVRDFLDEHGRFKVKRHTERMPFLPFIQNFASVIGGPQSPREMIKMMEKCSGISANISNSSLDNLSRSGVGKSIATKFFNFIASFREDFFTRSLKDLPQRPVSIYETYIEWRAALVGLVMANENDVGHFQLVIDFLGNRCNQAEQAFLVCKKLKDHGMTPLEAAFRYYDYLDHSMYLERKDIGVLKDLLVQYVEQGEAAIESDQYASVINLDLDFYFNLAAHYEVHMLMVLFDDIEDLKLVRSDILEAGVLVPIITLYRREDSLNTYFSAFLEFLKTFVEEGEYTDYKLARSIPILQGDKFSSSSLQEKKLNQLKDWKKGVNLPSYDKLGQFMVNLWGGDSILTDCFTKWGYICLAIDRYSTNLQKDCDSEIIDLCIARYKIYWIECREKYLFKYCNYN
ncbi:hypothetical protein AAFX60_007950 [Aliivibrio fischeri]